MQCGVFKEVYDRIFAIAENLGMTLMGFINFQADGVGTYALFFQEFVTKLVAFAKGFQETIEVGSREGAMMAGERVFTNLHLINHAFPFVGLVKPPGIGRKTEASRDATAGYIEELVCVFVLGDDEGDLEDSARAYDSLGENTNPGAKA